LLSSGRTRKKAVIQICVTAFFMSTFLHNLFANKIIDGMAMTPIIFLHGALGTEHQFDKLLEEVKTDREIHTITFEGHGDANLKSRPFRIEYFTDNVLDYMDGKGIEKADLFGYSMGGYVALYLSKIKPGRVGKIATLGTILEWNKEIAEKEAAFLIPDKIKEKVPKFAGILSEQHPNGWESVVNKTREALLYLGENPVIAADEWQTMEHPVRIHVGDRDQTADPVRSIQICSKLEKGELVVLPNSYHPIAKTDLHLLAHSLKDY